MKYRGVVYVNAKVAEELERLCHDPPGRDTRMGRDVLLYDVEHTFENGFRMLIQVCPGIDQEHEACWTQGVLLTPDGHELGCTEASEALLGEYYVFIDGDEYAVEVVVGDVPRASGHTE